MAIQMRRGALSDYDEDKMLAGELAVTTDEDSDDQQVFVAFAPGVSKRILTEGDILDNVKKLLLTHFWPEIDKDEYVNEAKEIFENTEAAVEGKKLILKVCRYKNLS